MNIEFTTDLYKVDHFKNGSVHVLRAIDYDNCKEYDFFLDDMTSSILDGVSSDIKVTGFVKFSDGRSYAYLKRITGGLGFSDVYYEYHKKM